MKSELFNQYAIAISEISGVETSDLFSKTKERSVTDARHLLYYMCSNRMMKLSHIRKHMKDNGYETGFFPISYGIKAVKKKLESDPDYVSIVNIIEKSINF